MDMLVLCGVLLMFSGSAEGLITVDSNCTSNQPCLFYGALGRPLYLQLPSESELKLRKNRSGTTTETILTFKNQTIRHKHPDPRWQFVTENRTMIISRAEKNHSGNYSLDTFDSGGTDRGKYQFQLIIEAEVSSVKVTYSCLSSVDRSVYCSSDGDQLSFSWTLNVDSHGHRLTDGNRTLLLDKGSTGTISCSVENHVSRGSQTIDLQECPGPTTVSPVLPVSAVSRCTQQDHGFRVFVSVWLFEVIVLVSLLVGAFYIYTRIYKKQRAAEGKKRELEEAL
ncbi:T-cell surface antigen CD2-like isoform X2 [Salminus brasiliensis]|uniref:T-cell surface antigen CD2-like isoform X2 n=1 Tax=Salminus brasiliensis TaxID=930266 RepID=UPI003B838435